MASTRTKALPTLTLKAGTRLFHGTRCVGEFEAPDGPAWFAFDRDKAREWCDWSNEPPKGRTHGEARVLCYEVSADVELLDTRTLRAWQRAGIALVDDDDPEIYSLAAAVARSGRGGWFGRSEVMLSEPSARLLRLAPEETDEPEAEAPRGP